MPIGDSLMTSSDIDIIEMYDGFLEIKADK